jgi:hypothetical protein
MFGYLFWDKTSPSLQTAQKIFEEVSDMWDSDKPLHVQKHWIPRHGDGVFAWQNGFWNTEIISLSKADRKFLVGCKHVYEYAVSRGRVTSFVKDMVRYCIEPKHHQRARMLHVLTDFEIRHGIKYD